MFCLCYNPKFLPNNLLNLAFSVKHISRRIPMGFIYMDKLPHQKDARQISNDIALLNPEKKSYTQKLKGTILIDDETNLSSINGIPEEQLKTRKVRIYSPVKNSTQSGTHNTGHWEIDFGVNKRWDHTLMGWCSTNDPLSNVKVKFSCKNAAVEYCKKNGWNFYIQEKPKKKKFKPKRYGIIFAWNKRTRTSTK